MFDGISTQDLPAAERRARLRLARSPRIGPVRFHEALQHFGSARAACAALPTAPDTTIAREEKRLLAARGRHIVFGDPAYPERLAALDDAPPALAAVGDLALLARPTVAIVGARNASLAGRRLAAGFAAALGAAGFAVVSGLARGIDSEAHRASLATGTIAVLAGGIDQIYPPENAGLQASIAQQGLLLAEAAIGAPPTAQSFPRRNRIVSGLALAVLVIEAGDRSGSLITARRAAEQGRDVFVVPGSPLDPRYAGSNALIRDGAILARDANDIFTVLGWPHSACQPTEKQREIPKAGLRAGILEALGPAPTAVDELVRRCQVSAATMAEALLTLELEGRLERHRGNHVSLI